MWHKKERRSYKTCRDAQPAMLWLLFQEKDIMYILIGLVELLNLKRPFLFPFYLLHEKPLRQRPLWRGLPGRRIQMMVVQTEVRKRICTKSSQLKLAGSGVGCEQRNDYRPIKTDVRHKQLKFDLNIYKNPGLSYKCYVWEGWGDL